MRLTLASARGLLSGWIIALTIPLLNDPRTIAAWSAAGLGGRSRLLLAAIELLGAALFAFETSVRAGLVLLVLIFLAAGAAHLHQGRIPWWLLAYAIAAILLGRQTLRASRVGAHA
jgi:hypothetical protein